ncbi:MAG: RluA family pseudouridine synthase [Candidatus Andersenbacteria bacterium]
MEKLLTVSAADAGQRLDVFCVSQLPGYSRAALQRAIREDQIKINNTTGKPRQIVSEGDVITIALPASAHRPEEQAGAPASLTFPILYEDRDVVVINKPAGVVVHAGNGREAPTVVSWLEQRYPAIGTVGEDAQRPGIVHRLDRETSGALIIAKTQAAYEHLKEQFQRRRAHKEYLALVFGQPGETKGRINRALTRSRRNPLRRTIASESVPTSPEGLRGAPKDAVTEWRLEEKLAGRFTLLRVFPLTGRTHQIRAHLHFLGFPIVGDALYTFKRQRPPHGVMRHLLHAQRLTVTLLTGKRKTFTAPLPPDFQQVLDALKQ